MGQQWTKVVPNRRYNGNRRRWHNAVPPRWFGRECRGAMRHPVNRDAVGKRLQNRRLSAVLRGKRSYKK